MGNICVARGQTQEAVACYQRPWKSSPNVKAQYSLGTDPIGRVRPFRRGPVHFQYGAWKSSPTTCGHIRHFADAWPATAGHQAIAHYRKALEIQPDDVDARNNLGLPGRRGRARRRHRPLPQGAWSASPDYAAAHNNSAWLWPLGEGKIDEAIFHYEKALAIKPDYAEAHNNLGVVLGNGAELSKGPSCIFRRRWKSSPTKGARQNLGTRRPSGEVPLTAREITGSRIPPSVR